MKAKENRFEKYKGCECATITIQNAPQDCQNASERNEMRRRLLGILWGCNYALGFKKGAEMGNTECLLVVDYLQLGNLQDTLQILQTKHDFSFSMGNILDGDLEDVSVITLSSFQNNTKFLLRKMAIAL